ncbi:Pkinase-domain-containing protein [Rhizoclosmatium globosum]|uniref:Pkinase-domain-containing protein n=1 Tax=Rhizoclosmatium globosum TaxID=329046 RepID=A0A1Y2CRF2_9FUNG|nr:Pkinase-domain-containing protein [Rhizoclosmatium globosum]|eukprot:ORY49536.1 Pkinase-domain-containing protein [Rhizoclosmatium globosum]
MTYPSIGSYRLMRTIGEGEFGKVKLAVHSETGAEVAIKLCKKSQVVATPNGYTKLMREISTLKLVKHHPFIITLIEVIETEAYIAIVMELAKGGELFEHILAKRSLGEQETRKLFAQIISAVGYIHSLGIVHRDLKLENILLDENQDVVLIDFGFANKTRGPNVMMRTSCGSPCYAAPELVTSDGYIGEKADLWSCGVILFSMIAGYLPWDDDPNNPEGDNINMLYNYIMNTPLDYPDHVPYECRLLINRILEPNPDKRADIDEIINHVWLKPIKHIFDIEMDRRMVRSNSFIRLKLKIRCRVLLAACQAKIQPKWLMDPQISKFQRFLWTLNFLGLRLPRLEAVNHLLLQRLQFKSLNQLLQQCPLQHLETSKQLSLSIASMLWQPQRLLQFQSPHWQFLLPPIHAP